MLREEFPALFNFMRCWFPDADLDGLSDKEVTAEYLKTINSKEHSQVLREMEGLLEAPVLPVDAISKESNRYFGNEGECRAWLSDVEKWLGDCQTR